MYKYLRRIILLVLLCMFLIDFVRTEQDKKPIFVISTAMAQDGGTIQYYGIGYKVIGWHKTELRVVEGKRIVGCRTGYEMCIFPFYKSIKNKPANKIKFVLISQVPWGKKNMVYNQLI